MPHPLHAYVAQHREPLEALMTSAMNAVFEERPEDPVDLLVRVLSAGRAKRPLDEMERSLAAAEERARAAEERAEKAEAAAEEYRAAAAAYRWRLAAAVAASLNPASNAGSGSGSAAWAPFEELLLSQSAAEADTGGGDKLTMPAKFFLFGQTKAFMDGLPGMFEGGLLRSMAEEARQNEGGKWWAEFAYVVERTAEEDAADLATTAKFKGKRSHSGETIVRDRGHAGLRLADFCAHEMARSAELTVAEVAAIRLYSGPMYAPINYALRTEEIAAWATTIGCCYSGVLKLSFISQPARVYRGVREDEMRLPDEFLAREEGKFAGGVERAFMSTTKSPAVALDYSGGAATSGSIFVIDFDMNSRGASIQWLSQYPHEEELLFPPCTGLACLDFSQHGAKRCIRVSAQVSTARLDTREIITPDAVPGTDAAMHWVAQLLGGSAEELAMKEEWNLQGKSLTDLEHCQRVALLLGRAARAAAPHVRAVDLSGTSMSVDGVLCVAEALAKNSTIMSLRCAAHPGTTGDRQHPLTPGFVPHWQS